MVVNRIETLNPPCQSPEFNTPVVKFHLELRRLLMRIAFWNIHAIGIAQSRHGWGEGFVCIHVFRTMEVCHETWFLPVLSCTPSAIHVKSSNSNQTRSPFLCVILIPPSDGLRLWATVQFHGIDQGTVILIMQDGSSPPLSPNLTLLPNSSFSRTISSSTVSKVVPPFSPPPSALCTDVAKAWTRVHSFHFQFGFPYPSQPAAMHYPPSYLRPHIHRLQSPYPDSPVDYLDLQAMVGMKFGPWGCTVYLTTLGAFYVIVSWK